MQTGIFYSGFRVSHPLRLDRGSRLYLRKSAKSADEPNTDTLTLNPRLFSAGLSGSLRLKWPVQTSIAPDSTATQLRNLFLIAALPRCSAICKNRAFCAKFIVQTQNSIFLFQFPRFPLA